MIIGDPFNIQVYMGGNQHLIKINERNHKENI